MKPYKNNLYKLNLHNIMNEENNYQFVEFIVFLFTHAYMNNRIQLKTYNMRLTELK